MQLEGEDALRICRLWACALKPLEGEGGVWAETGRPCYAPSGPGAQRYKMDSVGVRAAAPARAALGPEMAGAKLVAPETSAGAAGTLRSCPARSP